MEEKNETRLLYKKKKQFAFQESYLTYIFFGKIRY